MSDEKGMNIYSMPIEGEAEEPEQLTFLDSMNDLPVWSPDGKEIAFFSNQGGITRVWKMGADGRSPKPFEGTAAVLQGGSEIVWAPGPDILYQSSASGLENWSVLDPATGEERMLIDDPPAGYIFYPEWSPDGKEIAYFWNTPAEGRQMMRTWILSVEDGTRRMLLDEMTIPYVWADDGESIYISKPGQVAMGSRGEIYKMFLDTGRLIKYADMPFEKEIPRGRSAITPDGRKLVHSIIEEQSDIWFVENFDPDVK
jgi:Tol biopolymer transport system component